MTIEWKSNLNEHLTSQPNCQTMTEKLVLSFNEILIEIAEGQFKHLYTYLFIYSMCVLCVHACALVHRHTHISWLVRVGSLLLCGFRELNSYYQVDEKCLYPLSMSCDFNL